MSQPTFCIRGGFHQSLVLPNALSSGTWQTSQAARDAPNAGLAKLRQPALTNKDSLWRCCRCHNGASALQHPIFNQEWVSIMGCLPGGCCQGRIKSNQHPGWIQCQKMALNLNCSTLVSRYLKKCLWPVPALTQQLKSHNIWHMTFISLYSLFYKKNQFLTTKNSTKKEKKWYPTFSSKILIFSVYKIFPATIIIKYYPRSDIIWTPSTAWWTASKYRVFCCCFFTKLGEK